MNELAADSKHKKNKCKKRKKNKKRLPTVEEVCSSFGLNDVKIRYSEADYQNLNTYKSFCCHVRPILVKENPRVPIGKMMMLISAKWRDFSNQNPSSERTESDANKEPDYTPKPSRSGAAKVPVPEEIPDDDDEDYEDKVKKKRSSRSKKGAGSKKSSSPGSKVPTLKIKLGKRRRGSSDKEGGASGGADEKVNTEKNEAEGDTNESAAPVERKAKTKICKRKKKKKKQAISNSLEGDEERNKKEKEKEKRKIRTDVKQENEKCKKRKIADREDERGKSRKLTAAAPAAAEAIKNVTMNYIFDLKKAVSNFEYILKIADINLKTIEAADMNILLSETTMKAKKAYEEKKMQLAHQLYSIALSIIEPNHSNRCQLFYNRGTVAFEMKKFETAISDCENALQINNKYSKAYLRKGRSNFELQNYKAAVSDFEMAYAIEKKQYIKKMLDIAKCYQSQSKAFGKGSRKFCQYYDILPDEIKNRKHK